MKHSNFLWSSMILVCGILLAGCTENPDENQVPVNPITRSVADKNVTIATYVDVTTTNPLNAGLYRMGDAPFFDIVMLYGGNIGYTVNASKICLNTDLTAVLGETETYIRPLQQAGSKVLLSIYAESEKSGYRCLTEEQADKYTDMLVYIVDKYGLDGIDFYDQMGTNSGSTNIENSFSNVITMLRQKMDAKYPGQHKLITAIDLNSTPTLNAEAVDALDFAWSWVYSNVNYNRTSGIPGLPDSKWSPMALQLDLAMSKYIYKIVCNNMYRALNSGAGAIMMRNLLQHTERDPLELFQYMAQAAIDDCELNWPMITRDSESTGYAKDWTPASTETVILYTDTIVHEPEPEPDPDPDLANQTPLDSMRFVRAVSIDKGLVNPLNALSYVLPDGSPFFDIVTLEEASFHEMSDHNPDLWGGGPDYEKFVKPLQDKGIKVLLTIRSGSGRWGFANLTDAQIEDLATQIHEEVMNSKLNGVNLVDLGADYDDAYQPRPNDTSYSKMILALRKKLSDKRIITLRHVGYSSTLSQEAVKAIDRAWLFSGGATVYSVPAGAPEFPNRKWAPMRISAGNRQSSILQSRIKINTRRALTDEMGAIAFHLLDTIDISTTLTPVAQAIYGDSVTVTRTKVYYKE